MFTLLITCIALPSAATELNTSDVSDDNAPAGPQVIHIGTYVMDFSNYNAREGTYDASFYVTLTSDRPVNITDFELMNGHADTIGLLVDTPTKKYFRVFASFDSDPDFHRFPFDRHALPIIAEPRIRNTSDLIFVIDNEATGIDSLASLPGWKTGKEQAHVMNYTYNGELGSYSRVVFSTYITRDSLSTFLKFFLPVMLIVIVSLSSLLMKVTSRLGLNASMFLAAVLIHWRIADAMPMVEYATFLDYFMIITYATLVMVLISGILILVYNEAKNTEMIGRINHWSIRMIPAVSVVLYILLFLTLLL
ncbi:hypothetical protein [Methanoregula sp.]|uniref:hypothetical protein n=1 Tax=Methanoregula sp. TaxID=2052170 RepID=UPI0025D9C6CC|nr:hypothetical protein [Methanoregula sp.]